MALHGHGKRVSAIAKKRPAGRKFGKRVATSAKAKTRGKSDKNFLNFGGGKRVPIGKIGLKGKKGTGTFTAPKGKRKGLINKFTNKKRK